MGRKGAASGRVTLRVGAAVELEQVSLEAAAKYNIMIGTVATCKPSHK